MRSRRARWVHTAIPRESAIDLAVLSPLEVGLLVFLDSLVLLPNYAPVHGSWCGVFRFTIIQLIVLSTLFTIFGILVSPLLTILFWSHTASHRADIPHISPLNTADFHRVRQHLTLYDEWVRKHNFSTRHIAPKISCELDIWGGHYKCNKKMQI